MNNRLKEIAKQASCTIDGMGYGEGDVEQLAKLIIQECISACATDQLGKTASAEDLIKKHFGMECV
jgi:hypothetical protein